MGRKFLTNDFFLNRLKENGCLEKITPLEEYKGKNTKILFKCNKCGFEWKTRPDHITSGCGCPNCRNQSFHDKYSKTHEKFVAELYEKGILENIELLENYYANDIPILVKCKKCGYEWRIKPIQLLRGRLCRFCAIEKRKKQNIDFILELQEKGILSYLLPLEEYKGCKKKIKIKCLKCGEIWYASPDNILQGTKCPKCNKSQLENEIQELLDGKKINYIPQYIPVFLINRKSHQSLDFYLPEYNVAIECQGEQHFRSIDYWGGENAFKKQKERDETKYNLCCENGIEIIYYTKYKVPTSFNHKYLNRDEIIDKLNKLLLKN